MSNKENPSPKSIDTLVDDIYGLFLNKDHKISNESVDRFAQSLAEVIKTRLEINNGPDEIQNKSVLRLSKLGTKDRKLWFEARNKRLASEGQGEGFIDTTPEPQDFIKFLYGDIIEELLLFLVRESGHVVEGEQGEVEVNGIKGHRDCKIDGVTSDIKSTSSFSFKKFSEGRLFNDDPFGYIAQISSYCYADNSPIGAFLAMNKESGELALLKVNPVDMLDPVKRAERVKEVVELPEPPAEKCYEPVPNGTKGNMVLHRNCGYCPFKDECWSKDANNGQGLRKFRYSDGIKYFTRVVETPRVEEVVSET